jgi:hypothetical protein
MAFPHWLLLLFLEVCCPQEMDIPKESLLSLVPIDIPKVVAKSFNRKNITNYAQMLEFQYVLDSIWVQHPMALAIKKKILSFGQIMMNK